MKKNLIYQYWEGNAIPFYASVSQNQMKDYADFCEADYRFDLNHHYFNNTTLYSQYYNAFRPIFDKNFYEKYEKILFCDLDIFITNLGKSNNIFDEPINNIGICEEKQQPELRYGNLCQTMSSINGDNDEKWAKKIESYMKIKLPRDEKNRLKVFNSGVVLYTQDGLSIARENFMKFSSYIDITKSAVSNSFYQLDQNYLHSMLEYAFKGNYTILDADKWNAQMHRIIIDKNRNTNIFDGRTKKTNFVHMQIRPRDKLTSTQMIETVINEPVNSWGFCL